MSSRLHWPRAVFRAKTRGQALIIAAIMLPFIIAFVLLVIEVSERWLEVALMEDALQQASRSAVQVMDYAAMARNQEWLRGVPATGCAHVTQAEPGACRAVVEVATTFLTTNLSSARGLAEGESVAAIARRVRWTILPNGGRCRYSNGAERTLVGQPLICAEVRPALRGIVGWGDYTPFISASDTLDAAR